jgi:hypothetical protein
VVRFIYDPRRNGEVPVRLLQGWEGYLMTDGYAAYHKVGNWEGVEVPIHGR